MGHSQTYGILVFLVVLGIMAFVVYRRTKVDSAGKADGASPGGNPKNKDKT